MADYQDLYKQGLPYFQHDVEKILAALEQKQCVALCSAYKMGDHRFVDYLYSLIKDTNQYDVFYDAENSYTKNKLIEFQEKHSDKNKVLLLPWFWRMNQSVVKEYTSIMRDKRNKFTSVIILDPTFLDKPEKLFPDTNTPTEIMITRSLLLPGEISKLLLTREKLANRTIPQAQKKKIGILSGGHIGLAKRLFTLAVQGETISLENLIVDTAIRSDLLNLEHQIQTLSQSTAKKIGLLDKNNQISIPLLQRFIANKNKVSTVRLSPLYQQILSIFLAKEGAIVSKKELHEIINKEKVYSLWAVYKTISRFKNAIKPIYELRTVNGKGYLLTRNIDHVQF